MKGDNSRLAFKGMILFKWTMRSKCRRAEGTRGVRVKNLARYIWSFDDGWLILKGSSLTGKVDDIFNRKTMKIFKRKRNDGNSEVYDGNISLS
jgi:hypothetical protein